MSQYQIELATGRDDPFLRNRMASDWMRGHVSVSFRREPNYFEGCSIQGQSSQVIKCTDTQTGEIVGMGSRAIYPGYLNGKRQRLGYLSDLRTAQKIRSGTLLARGYRYLRELHREDPVPFYFSLILQGNNLARGNLVGARCGLPEYRSLGKIHNPAIHLDLPKREAYEPGVSVVQANEDTRFEEVFQFLQKNYRTKQFAPHYEECDLSNGRLKGLKKEDFYLALKGGQIVGVVAAWDQGMTRQTHVEQYSRSLEWIRPIYNSFSKLSPLKKLPDPGSRMPYFYLSLIAVENDHPGIFHLLLRHVYRERRRGKWHYMILGLHEKNPLHIVLEGYRKIGSSSELFSIHYPEDNDGTADGRVPHIELGAV